MIEILFSILISIKANYLHRYELAAKAGLDRNRCCTGTLFSLIIHYDINIIFLDKNYISHICTAFTFQGELLEYTYEIYRMECEWHKELRKERVFGLCGSREA